MELGGKTVNFAKNSNNEIIAEIKTTFPKKCPKIGEILF